MTAINNLEGGMKSIKDQMKEDRNNMRGDMNEIKGELSEVKDRMKKMSMELENKVDKKIEEVETNLTIKLTEQNIELSEKIDECRMEENKTRSLVAELELKHKRDVEQLSQEIRENRNVKVVGEVTRGTVINTESVGKLKFRDNRQDDPFEFILKLKSQIKLYMSWEEIKEIIQSHLLESAYCWFLINQNKFHNFQMFMDEFISNFGSETYKAYLLGILNGDYLNFEKMSPTEYLTHFSTRMITAKIFEENTLCSLFNRHFGERVYNICINRRVGKISELFDVLNMIPRHIMVNDLRSPGNNSLLYNHRPWASNSNCDYVPNTGFKNQENVSKPHRAANNHFNYNSERTAENNWRQNLTYNNRGRNFNPNYREQNSNNYFEGRYRNNQINNGSRQNGNTHSSQRGYRNNYNNNSQGWNPRVQNNPTIGNQYAVRNATIGEDESSDLAVQPQVFGPTHREPIIAPSDLRLTSQSPTNDQL
ncbi:uncharacterized protein [Halyomorpha halys]|uniref:uncharacterized protein n=1 Tax=Halyomorpha halys TaxID=286706 RepID=UPI0034D25607